MDGSTRREVLKWAVAGVGALNLLALPRPARAVGRFAVGDSELTVVSDGTLSLPVNLVFPDVPEAELERLLSKDGTMPLAITPDCNVTFLRSGGRLAVFDAGSGANFMPTAGKLLDNLEQAGIDPAEVTHVIFTHAHPDHLWGVVDAFDDLVFPEAAYFMAETEWDFWRADETLARVPEERQGFVVGARNRMAMVEDRMSLFKPGVEVFPGVEAVDTAGHTPGHVSFMVHGSAEDVLIVGDAIANVAVSFAKPEWPTGSDHDPAMGAAARVQLLDRLAGEKTRIVGYHLPHPGAGIVERAGAGYRFVSAD
jgi:glyoxylase-like metal-dependent hydrolase (beta-lactamase superfamily II)